jgi:hypothetical protein
MSAWDVPADILRLAKEKLRNDLGSDPVSCLRKSMLPWEERINLYSFSIADNESEHVTHMFMFSFVFSECEQFLDMTHCGYQRTNSKPDRDENQQRPQIE